MLELWREFLERPLFDQVGFILPFVGTPTIFGILLNRSTKQRLRKMSAGQAAEIALLKTERDELRRASLSYLTQQASLEDDEYRNEHLAIAFARSKESLVVLSEQLGVTGLLSYWETGDEQALDEALYFGKIALAVDGGNLIARTLLEEASTRKDPTAGLDEDLQEGLLRGFRTRDHELIFNAADNVARECKRLQTTGEVDVSIRLAKFMMLSLSACDLLHSRPAYNIVLMLVQALIAKVGDRPTADKDKEELRSTSLLLTAIAENAFPDENHVAWFVAKFHEATVLHLLGQRQEALELLENDGLPAKAPKFVGLSSPAGFATRHLYANLLYEVHRPQEAERVVNDLQTDLAAHGMLSSQHVSTYGIWARLAGTGDYRSGKQTRFPNTATFAYG